MKRVFLFVVFLFTITPILAQTSNLDELPLPVLKQKLAESSNDTTRVKLQLALGHLMLLKPTTGAKDIDSARKFAVQASVLSRRLNYDFGIINSMLLNVETFYSRKDREAGLKIAQNALAFSQKRNNIDGQARSYHLIAQYYQVSDPVEIRNRIFYINKAIALFRKERNILWLSFLLTANADLSFQAEKNTEGLKLLFEALNLGKGVSRRTIEGIYFHIGRNSFRLGDYDNALKYNLLALQTAREVNDTTFQTCEINHSIAATYIKMQKYDKAVPYSAEVMRMAKRYNATYYINLESSTLAQEYTHTNQLSKALSILNEMKNRAYSDLDKLSVSVDFLNSFTYAKRFVQAGQYAQQVKDLLAGIAPHNVTELMNAYNALASYYLETKQTKLAYHFADLHAAMARKLNYISGIRTAENRYYKLVSLKGDLKSAVGHFLRGKEIEDSIANIAKAYQISLLNIENETLEKSRHIDSLTREAEINEIELKRNQLVQKFTIGGFIMLLIITGLIYSRYRLKQRSAALLMSQKSEIDRQNTFLQHLLSDKNQLIGEKDELLYEKDLLLKEVNHRVKNNLQIVMSLLESQSGYTQNVKAQEAIQESQNRVQAIALIHDTLYHTDKITEIALKPYIADLINSLNSSINTGWGKVMISYDVDDMMLDVAQAIPVGLILNESVTNALKYAFPGGSEGEIKVIVKQEGECMQMQIGDNGVGLPDDFDLFKAESLGLTLIKGLTSQLGGVFDITYRKGVTILVKFPLEIAAAMV